MAAMRLRVMALHMLTGNVMFALSQFLMVVIIARLEGAEVLGSYALAQAVALPVFAFTSMGLRPAIASDYKYYFHLSVYLKFWACTAGLGVLISWLVASMVDLNELSYVLVFAVILGRLAESLSFVCYGFFQRLESMKRVNISMVLRGLSGLLAMVSVIYMGGSIVNAIFAAFIAWVAILIIIDLPGLYSLHILHPEGFKRSSEIQLRMLIKKVLPLGFLALFTAMTQHAPRYFINYFIGTSAVGYFSAVVQIANIGALVINSAGQSLVSRLAQYFTVNISAYKKLLRKALYFALIVGFAGVIVVVVIGEQLLATIYSDDFSGYSVSLVMAMIWTGVLYVSATLGVGLTSSRNFLQQAFIGGAALVVLLLACLMLISPFGLVGAFLAMIISVSFKGLLQFFILRRIISRVK